MNINDARKDHKSLTVLIFEKIREDILDGRYKAGDKLNELHLAEELNVSRTPVREALKQLAADGIVEDIPNRGMIVIGISPQDLEDIYFIRQAIDEVAIRWAIERITGDELKTLIETYELMEFYSRKNDLPMIFKLINQFHEIINSSTKSPFLENVLLDFHQVTKSIRFNSLSRPGRLEEVLIEHKNILDAVKAKNSKKAVEAVRTHSEGLEK
jgi:DNA-binding GntR family transcriptional regulator